MRRPHFRIAALLPCAVIAATCLGGCGQGTSATEAEREQIRLAALGEREIPSYIQDLDREDPIGSFYRNKATKEATLAFCASLTRSVPVAEAILANAERYGVPASLAFALAFEESKFTVEAINRNVGSIDRGLFQLNSKSFPSLKIEEFYDLKINAKYGLSHLQHCLRSGGNEVAALAMYNAGNGRVDRGATPKKTLDYVFRILKYQENIASLFQAKVAAASRDRSLFSRLSLGLIAPPRPR
jgi:soluble lytic murein transglycosylase-like protein